MSNKEDLGINDTVEVINDNRQWLNGRRGIIFDIIGDRIYVEFNDGVPTSEKRAVFLPDNLVKVEPTA